MQVDVGVILGSGGSVAERASGLRAKTAIDVDQSGTTRTDTQGTSGIKSGHGRVETQSRTARDDGLAGVGVLILEVNEALIEVRGSEGSQRTNHHIGSTADIAETGTGSRQVDDQGIVRVHAEAIDTVGAGAADDAVCKGGQSRRKGGTGSSAGVGEVCADAAEVNATIENPALIEVVGTRCSFERDVVHFVGSRRARLDHRHQLGLSEAGHGADERGGVGRAREHDLLACTGVDVGDPTNADGGVRVHVDVTDTEVGRGAARIAIAEVEEASVDEESAVGGGGGVVDAVDVESAGANFVEEQPCAAVIKGAGEDRVR